MSALALSVLLSFVSAVAYAGGAIVQEQVAVSSPDGSYMPLRRTGWWAALALNGLGGGLHVVALAYGPLSLVQPLGALTIVFALPMAALFVGRRAGATAWRGAVMATVGLAGLLSLVGSSDVHSLDAAQRVAVALVTGGAVAALMCAGLAVHRHPAVRSVLLAAASGMAFGMSSVFTKTVAVDWDNGISLADLPSLAVIGVFATAGVLLSQASYRGGGLAAPLATLTVVNPVLAAAVGIMMFGETFRYGTTGTVLALGCGVVAAGGLILLTTERLERAPAAAPATEPVSMPETESGAGEGLVAVPHQRAETEAEAAVEEALDGRPPAGEAFGDRLPAGDALDDRPPVEAATASPMLIEEAFGDRLPVDEALADRVLIGETLDEQVSEEEGGPSAAASLPVPYTPASYTPLSASFYVPVPVRRRHRTRVTS
ncbi:DMT family transporter [Streptomyces sp. NPDC101151]|uniref:DMT family transporter n=1 Tax=Streptomyces sp. NPDC101151 TaxID=3366115 RepID=UPI0037FAD91E